jgi:hypothetical protein
MLQSKQENIIPGETIKVIFKVIQQANEPLTAEEIQHRLPGPYKIDLPELTQFLNEQVQTGAVYRWQPKSAKGTLKKFWHQGLEAYSFERIVQMLSDSATGMTRKEMKKALKKKLFGYSDAKSEALVRNALKQLLKEQRFFEHPPLNRERVSRIRANPVNPALYFGKVKKEFDAVYSKLNKAGVSPEQIFHALNDILLPGENPYSGIQNPCTNETQRSHDIYKTIVDKILEIEPAAPQQVLVSVQTLRAALDLSKQAFDQAFLNLESRGEIFLHRHVYPAQMTEDELEQMVTDGRGNYYMGIVLRNPDDD